MSVSSKRVRLSVCLSECAGHRPDSTAVKRQAAGKCVCLLTPMKYGLQDPTYDAETCKICNKQTNH